MTGEEQSPFNYSLEQASTLPVCAGALLRNWQREQAEGEALASLLGGKVDSDYVQYAIDVVEEGIPTTKPKIDCGLCGGEASINDYGQAKIVGNCMVTGSCELSMASVHSELYTDEDGKPVSPMLPCGGIDCKALVGLYGPNGDFSPGLVGDVPCTVDVNGKEYREKGRLAFNSMEPVRPEDGIEHFDGERL